MCLTEVIILGGTVSMDKHAYLVMAHNNWEVLKRQIKILDSRHNDFFIHVDKKIKDFPIDIEDWAHNSNVRVFHEINDMWADYSQIECELFLLKKATECCDYSFYHLLSGTDLPLKCADYIYEFFEKNKSKNFIGIVPNEVYYSVRRVKYFHLLTSIKSYRDSKLLKGLDRLFEYCQRIVFVNRLKQKDIKIIDGWQWFSINKGFAKYILNKKSDIDSIFKKSIASDELVFQTMAYNSDYRDTLYDETDLKNGSMRYIDWERGRPYIWGQDEKDYDLLIKSPYMFARKFDEKYMEIVNRIYNDLIRSSTE